MMTDLQEAVDRLTDGPLLKRISRHNADQFASDVAQVAAAVQDLLKAPAYEWCDEHKCRGQEDWCWMWAGGVAGKCRMETVRVVPAPEVAEHLGDRE